MKLITFLIFAGTLASYATAHSQPINLEFRDSTLSAYLDEIEKNTNFIFVYDASTIDLTSKKSITAKAENINAVLDKLFQGTKTKYLIDGRQVFLFCEDKPKIPDMGKVNPAKLDSLNEVDQQNKITGIVTDQQGLPITGATVVVKGTTFGALTDGEGKYTLTNVSPNATLVFTFIGMTPQEIPLNNQTRIDVVMKEAILALEEVVVIGYGVQKKATVTGAISSVSAKDLIKSPVGSITTAMVGRLPGIITMQRSGLPGAESPILRIRGVSTLNGADPLIIVDGIESAAGYVPQGADSPSGGISGFEQINPNDIESISILKDASSTAVYGVRGANGVIIITTKRGIKGSPKIQLSGNYGMSTPVRLRNNVSSYEWGMYANEGNANDGIVPQMSAEQLEHFRTGDNPILYPSLNYADYALNDFAPRQNYNISMNGGTDNVRYYVSAGYLNEEGLVKDVGYGFDPNYHYNRLNLRSNVDFDFTKTLSGGVNIDTRLENRSGPNAPYDAGFFWRLYRPQPYISPGIIDGKYIVTTTPIEAPIMQQILAGGYYRSLQTTVNTIFSLKQKFDFITKGLYAQGKFSYDNWYVEKYTRTKTYATYSPIEKDGTIYYKRSGADGPLSYVLDENNASNKMRKDYLELSLNYSRSFGDHSVTALALYNQNKSYFTQSQYRDIPRAYMGFVSRFTYSYLNRYLAEFNFGLNGSENFPKGGGKRFGKFPAFSVGWVASDEAFMKPISFINHLKLRASYGSVGSDQIGAERFLYVSGSFVNVPTSYSYYFGDATSTQSYLGLQEGRMANNDITWEVAKKINLGLETKLLQEQLTFNLDLFKENRSNILTYMATIPNMMMPVMRSGSTGWTNGSIAPPVNYAKVENKGYEIELGWNSKIGKFGYNINASLTHAENKRTLISETTNYYPWLYGQGQSIGQYYGFIAEGYFDSFGEIYDINNAYSSYGKDQIPGDIKYKDINGDMKIDANDVVPIGYSNTPRKTFSLNLGCDYKGFDLSALFQGAAQVNFLPAEEAQIQFYGGFDAFDWVVNRWTPETRDAATYPVLHKLAYNNTSSNNFKPSTYWLKDASYVRLKNLEIGYDLSTRITKQLKISDARIYLNGQNLFTLDKLKYFDPESIQNRLVLYPIMRVYNIGISIIF